VPDTAAGLLPARSQAWAAGLGEPDVLTALGAAGRSALAEYSARGAVRRAGGLQFAVRIAAFPFGRCVVYAARMARPE
jgi:hypothetical protein